MHLACQSLRSGEIDLALAGGVNFMLAPDTSPIPKLQMMAADGRCKTFDAAADGLSAARAVGSSFSSALSEAERGGDPILAVIRGSAVNQDGRTNGLTAPSGKAPAAGHRAGAE